MTKERVNFYKYFPVSDEDASGGIYIENIGVSEVLKGEQYPLSGHPVSHYFTYDKGRYLSSFQILLIADGQGIFESKSTGVIGLHPGSMILLYPNEWHRYRPLEKTGWKEYWIGFHGEMGEKLANNSAFKATNPVLYIKDFAEIQSLYDDAISYAVDELPGFQQIVTGLLFQIFGNIVYCMKNKSRKSRSFMKQVNLARELMQSNINENVDVTEIAKKLDMSYTLFRKKFKQYTGMSPKEYQVQLKLKRAKSLLLGSDLPINIIAIETGYESIYHFSKIFKEKTGYSPSQYRQVVEQSRA